MVVVFVFWLNKTFWDWLNERLILFAIICTNTWLISFKLLTLCSLFFYTLKCKPVCFLNTHTWCAVGCIPLLYIWNLVHFHRQYWENGWRRQQRRRLWWYLLAITDIRMISNWFDDDGSGSGGGDCVALLLFDTVVAAAAGWRCWFCFWTGCCVSISEYRYNEEDDCFLDGCFLLWLLCLLFLLLLLQHWIIYLVYK